MYVNEKIQKQLNKFEAFVSLMGDMGMTFNDYDRTDDATRDTSLSNIRTAITTKRYSGCGNADAYFKHPSADVLVHIEVETPLCSFNDSKVRVLVTEGRQSWGDRENPYRPLGKASTLKKRIEERVAEITERDDHATRQAKFFTLNKPAAEQMILQLTGTVPRVYTTDKGWQNVEVSYRGVTVEVSLSMLIKEGTQVSVSMKVSFNSRDKYKTITLVKWVEVVDQLHDLGILG